MKQRNLKPTLALVLCAVLLALGACGAPNTEPPATENTAATTDAGTTPTLPAGYEDATQILLNADAATVNGEAVPEYDYTWHTDPSTVHDEVKNAPADYYTGSRPDDPGAVYIDHELYYFPQLDTAGFRLVNYDGEQEWAYYYTDGTNDSYIYATLPHLGSALPTAMMHSEEEAAENKVLHITAAGTYFLAGTWNGQIRIDLGEDAFTDPTQKVTLILGGVNVTCTVAPGILFENLYECDNAWESADTHSAVTDLADAGAALVLADGSENTVSGCNIYRMLKTKYKDDATGDVKTQKKLRKLDAALYSCVSLTVGGSGKLTVNASFEGLDSELHLAMNGGTVEIHSQDDAINVNEDHVSTFVMNGGTLTLYAHEGFEGDGIDSNGFAVLGGGTLSVYNVVAPDAPVDTEDGVTYNGGTILVNGAVLTGYETGKVYREIGAPGQPGQPGQPGDVPPEGFPEGNPPEGEPPAKPEGDEQPPKPDGDRQPPKKP